MNEAEARAVLSERLLEYRALSYAELRLRIGGSDVREVRAPSGVRYQVDIIVVWDAEPEGAIRVIGSVDDGGLRAFRPLTDSFILSAAGGLAGE